MEIICDEVDSDLTYYDILDKALEISIKYLKQNNIQFCNNHIGIVASHCEELEDEYITQTEDDIREYLLEQAKKKLESEKQ